ncbi:MAG: hypothetical protein RIS47_102, partial [Bacteroidota bacterium]
MKMKLFQFCLFMVVALVYSCGLDSHLPREGTINYQINYLSDRKSNPIISYLPETMKVYFKDNKTVTEIQGYMGFFSLKYYTNAKRHVNCSYLRILDKQYIYLAPTDELAYGFDNM